jgi:hypothetical protein
VAARSKTYCASTRDRSSFAPKQCMNRRASPLKESTLISTTGPPPPLPPSDRASLHPTPAPQTYHSLGDLAYESSGEERRDPCRLVRERTESGLCITKSESLPAHCSALCPSPCLLRPSHGLSRSCSDFPQYEGGREVRDREVVIRVKRRREVFGFMPSSERGREGGRETARVTVTAAGNVCF